MSEARPGAIPILAGGMGLGDLAGLRDGCPLMPNIDGMAPRLLAAWRMDDVNA